MLEIEAGRRGLGVARRRSDCYDSASELQAIFPRAILGVASMFSIQARIPGRMPHPGCGPAPDWQAGRDGKSCGAMIVRLRW